MTKIIWGLDKWKPCVFGVALLHLLSFAKKSEEENRER